MKTLIFGSDHAGLSLKNFLTSVLSVEYDINIIDIGTFTNDSCDYPDYAKEVCESVLNIENSLDPIREFKFCFSALFFWSIKFEINKKIEKNRKIKNT